MVVGLFHDLLNFSVFVAKLFEGFSYGGVEWIT